MLLLTQRRAEPVRFRSADLLGGASKVVPAGTLVRLPAVPNSLDFSGYNTLSLAATIAGLSGGDSFVLAADTVDPESATGAVLASSLGRLNAITTTANGSKAATVSLRPRVLTPSSDVTPVDTQWGRYGSSGGGPPPFATTWQCVNTKDDFTSFIARNANPDGTYTYKFGLTGVIAGTSFPIAFRATRLFAVPMGDHVFLTFSVVTDTGAKYDSPEFNCTVFTDSWVNYSTTVNIAQATGIAPHNSLWITARVPTPVGVDVWCAITYMALNLSDFAAPSGNPGIFPFMSNALVLDATACAHDVTVSGLVAELTNA